MNTTPVKPDRHMAYLNIIFNGGHNKSFQLDMDKKEDRALLMAIIEGPPVITIDLPIADDFINKKYSEVTSKTLRIRRDQISYIETTYVTYHEEAGSVRFTNG